MMGSSGALFTLKTGLDDIKGMDNKCGDGASCEAGYGFN